MGKMEEAVNVLQLTNSCGSSTISREPVMQSTAKLLAGAAGLTTAFVAGCFAKDKYNQAKFEKAVPFLPRESLAETAKNKACVAPFQLKAEAGAQAERTFIMIKPDGVQRGLVGKIVKRFEQKGFKLVAIRMMRPGEAHLREHYADLAARPFFPGLVSYKLWTSGSNGLGRPGCCQDRQGDAGRDQSCSKQAWDHQGRLLYPGWT